MQSVIRHAQRTRCVGSLVPLCFLLALVTPPYARAKDRQPVLLKSDSNTLLVRFADPVASKGKIKAEGDGAAGKTAGKVDIVRIQPGEVVARKVEEYEDRPDVIYAEPNFVADTGLGPPRILSTVPSGLSGPSAP